MSLLENIIFYTALILGLLAPIFRSIEHIIEFRFNLSIFNNAPKWLKDFLIDPENKLGIFDGFHVFGGLNDFGLLLAGFHIATQFPWYYILIYIYLYYFVFNLFFHIFFMIKADRNILQCLPIINIFFL